MFARALVALALAVFAAGASAQTYPAKPVRIINPFAPGGATDQLARLDGTEAHRALGPERSGREPPGRERRDRPRSGRESRRPTATRSLIATQTTHAANPALYAKLPYDADARLRSA